MINYPESFYSSVSKRAIESSKIIAQVLQEVINPRSIIDIGSGEGIWLNTIGRCFPSVKSLTALDLQVHISKHFDELTQMKADFKFIERNFELDCSLPNEKYDLAICLEVLEHLQKQTAELLVREISRKTSVIVFSAAMKGQGGTGHINENSLDYWVELLASNGFIPLDVFRNKLKISKSVPDYYKQNLILFWHPENCRRNGTNFDLEKLLINNPMKISDNRSYLKRIRYFLTSIIPPKYVTLLVVALDKSVRR